MTCLTGASDPRRSKLRQYEYLQNDFYSLLSVKAPFDVLSTSKQTDTVASDLSLTPVEQNLSSNVL